MTADTTSPDAAPRPKGLPALPSGRFTGRSEFQHHVRDVFAVAARQGWRELVLSDAGFEDWPLQERVVVESLQHWARPGRRLVMVARSYDAVLRNQHRFVSWRRTWSHLVDCRVNRRVDAADFPSLLWSPSWALRRLDPVLSTGVCGEDARRRVEWREMLDALLLDSGPGFPATVLGL